MGYIKIEIRFELINICTYLEVLTPDPNERPAAKQLLKSLPIYFPSLLFEEAPRIEFGCGGSVDNNSRRTKGLIQVAFLYTLIYVVAIQAGPISPRASSSSASFDTVANEDVAFWQLDHFKEWLESRSEDRMVREETLHSSPFGEGMILGHCHRPIFIVFSGGALCRLPTRLRPFGRIA
jgi:hypothetical protein